MNEEELNGELNEEFEDNIIVLNDENGEEVQFEFLDLIEYQDNRYVVLLPVEGEDSNNEDDAGEVVILKVDHLNLDDPNDNEESYSSVEDEETLNTIFEIFKEKANSVKLNLTKPTVLLSF